MLHIPLSIIPKSTADVNAEEGLELPLKKKIAVLTFLGLALVVLSFLMGFFTGNRYGVSRMRGVRYISPLTATEETMDQMPSESEPAPTQIQTEPPSAPTQIQTEAGNAGKVNINTAELEELKTLPSIGEVRAKAIITHRQENGAFTSIEQILDVSGIGEGVFNQIKDWITVG